MPQDGTATISGLPRTTSPASLLNLRQASRAVESYGSKRLQQPRSIQHKPLPPSPAPLFTHELHQLLDALEDTVGSIDYVVGGRAAMAVWGFTHLAPAEVDVLCPPHAFDNFQYWAATKGLHLYKQFPDVIGVPMRDGNVRSVRLAMVDGPAFESWHRVQPHRMSLGYAGMYGNTIPTRAHVLSLASLLDVTAGEFLLALEGTQRRRELGMSLIWLLKRIADGGFVEEGGYLCPRNVPHVLTPGFWHTFTDTYDHGEGAGLRLLQDVGLTYTQLHVVEPGRSVSPGTELKYHAGADCRLTSLESVQAASCIYGAETWQPGRRLSSTSASECSTRTVLAINHSNPWTSGREPDYAGLSYQVSWETDGVTAQSPERVEQGGGMTLRERYAAGL
ncbi:hypothetical protein GQ53DRAFT_726486 [Thozetella sp. PMI_491]|nr:hypothetical protein GQ53DRAFT_726486 [Thozetella sp. PMI_491]